MHTTWNHGYRELVVRSMDLGHPPGRDDKMPPDGFKNPGGAAMSKDLKSLVFHRQASGAVVMTSSPSVAVVV